MNWPWVSRQRFDTLIEKQRRIQRQHWNELADIEKKHQDNLNAVDKLRGCIKVTIFSDYERNQRCYKLGVQIPVSLFEFTDPDDAPQMLAYICRRMTHEVERRLREIDFATIRYAREL